MERPIEEFEATRYDNLPRLLKFFFLVLTIAGVGVGVFYIFGFSVVGKVLYSYAYYYLLIACFLPLAFLTMPMRKRDKGIQWYDGVLTALAFGISFYFFLKAANMAIAGWYPVSQLNFILAFILFLLVLEAGRRVGGIIFPIVCAVFGFYPLFAEHMPGLLFGIPSPLNTTMGFHMFSTEAMLGLPTQVTGEILLGFLIFGSILVASGAGRFFLNLAMALLGRFRGGPAKVAVLSSAFFGSLSGSIFANVISTGCVTIPTMKRLGYPPHYAGAVEACSSTGGVLMPPVMGAVAFVMCTLLNIEYKIVMLAAVFPSILYYFGLLMQVDAYAARVGLKGIPREEKLPSLKRTLVEGWPFIAVLVFLVWGLLYMRWERLTPFYASGLMILLSFTSRKTMMTPGRIIIMFKETGKLLMQTMALILPIGFILGGLVITGTAPAFTAGLISLGGGNIIPILILGIAVCYILGMVGMMIPAYVFLAVTLAPAIIEVSGANAIAVHLFILYWSMLSAFTPPVALAAFVAAGIAKADPMKTAFQAMRLGVVIYFVPFFFLFRPALVFQGPILEGFYLFLLCLVGIMLVAGGIEGYLVKLGKVAVWARPLLVVGGFLIALPEWKTTIIGAAIALFAIVVILGRRRMQTAKARIQ